MNKIIGCGAITDGTYKLKIHVINFSNDDYFLYDIKKDDHVEIIGIMQATIGNKLNYSIFTFFILIIV